jgi:hypothetical protein
MDQVDPVQARIFRSRVADFLFGLTFPATKEQIIRQARHNNTASQVTEALNRLPDRAYADLADVQVTVVYFPPRVWDVEGFPPEAIEHDQIEGDRIRRNITRAER